METENQRKERLRRERQAEDIILNTFEPKYGFTLSMCDTDSIMVNKPDEGEFTDEEKKILLDEINNRLPGLIFLDDDGYYESVAVIKSKNYILKETGKSLKLKGSSITDQKKELALLSMIDKVSHSVINGINYSELTKIYLDTITEVITLDDISNWSQKKTVTKAVLNCATDPTARANEMKVYQAIKDKNPQEGDKIWVYASQDGMKQKFAKDKLVFLKSGEPKMEKNFIIKTVDEYDNDHVENKLLKRCYDTIKIFSTILDMDNFLNYSLTKNQVKIEEMRRSL